MSICTCLGAFRPEDLSETSGVGRVQVGQVQILPIQKVEHLGSQQPDPRSAIFAEGQGEIDARKDLVQLGCCGRPN
jgi:hypothetical protein